MKISSGKYRSRLIRMPKNIRPTQAKVRKALFDILGDIKGLSFLELFAGSGAVGFEALSRGAADLTLAECNHDCLQAIRKNIESLQIKDCSLYPHQAQRAIEMLHKQGRKFDIIFLDPPYYMDAAKKTLKALGGYDILTRNGLLIVQHFKKDTLDERTGSLTLIKRARYGDTLLSFYRKVA
ncbi:MAG: 16S rRNA (guanine(966)-N(2))-methyltransferase RsmD [Candidatus Omnitrophota bacterium]|nr:16S rRNA (guanine(966)-N(2))-methyltransferase RsmD [Candidatus Omnitrophota bacterium]